MYYRDQIIGAIIQMRRKPIRTGKLPSLEPQHSNRGVPATIGTKESEDVAQSGVIGKSPQWLSFLGKIKKVAKRDMSVLLIGESGTGKEVLSQYIHSNSLRKDKAFVAMNCATLAHVLVASELFGYAPGSFTGGMKEGKAGLFEAAHGGTVFLDEIAELPLPIQAMLLRVLQEKQVTRIGEYRPRPLDVRIIAATNKDLKKTTEEGKFRLDLYYRLNVIELKVPSLRERQDDVVHFAEYFLRKQNPHVSDYILMPETVEILQSYDWPGNVREMKNVMEHALVFADNARILPAHLPDHIVESAGKKEKKTQEALTSQYEENRPKS